MASGGNMDDEFFGTPLSTAMNMPFNLEVGDIVLGRVSQIDEDYVYVSTGFKSEGRIPVNEFRKKPDQEIDLKVDSEIEVMVDRISGEEIFLSYSKVVEQRRWDELVKHHEDEEPITATVIKMVKGGFRLDVGVSRHGFLPASHWGDALPENTEDVEGKEVRVVIIEIDKGSGNIVVSQRELMKKEMSVREEEVFKNLQMDSIIEGKVTRLTNFGAFVDIGGGVEGLVHISELAWTRVGHPSQLLSCGDNVKVKILSTDSEKKKISLSIKHAQEDPWNKIEEQFKIDEVVEGTVTRAVKYGFFVKLAEDFEGLLHISEVPDGENQKKPVAGDKIKVKILNIDKSGRRLKLGLAHPTEGQVSSDMEQYIDNGKNSVTLGDVLGGALDEPESKE